MYIDCVHSQSFENSILIILQNRSVSWTQTRRTVIMKCHLASQAYVERIFFRDVAS